MPALRALHISRRAGKSAAMLFLASKLTATSLCSS
jgi:hypothetical protein